MVCKVLAGETQEYWGVCYNFGQFGKIEKRNKESKKCQTTEDDNMMRNSKISYVRTGEGFDYLCRIRDVFTNTVLAQCSAKTMKAELVVSTLKAVQNKWYLAEDVIFHSDRGSQYTAQSVTKQVASYGWRQSFSRVGKPGDNSWSESFFSILKKEIIHWLFYKTRGEARQRIFEYIEVFYNCQRAQKRLGYLSPIQYLKQWQKRQLTEIA
jgi:putative transposase